jgi:hypothetical protein
MAIKSSERLKGYILCIGKVLLLSPFVVEKLNSGQGIVNGDLNLYICGV